MTESHFSQQLTRLQENFGRTAYSTERTKLLWREVKDLSPEWLTGVVDSFIGSMRHAPLIPDFSEQASTERERLRRLEKDRGYTPTPNATADCEWCRDNGVYICLMNGNRSAPYAFRCHCKRGAADPRKQIPQYKQTHVEQGFTYYELSWSKEMRA